MRDHTDRIRLLIPGTPEIRKFIVIIYLTGVAGIILPITRPLFIQLIPVVLLLTSTILAVFHLSGRVSRLLVASLTVFLLSYAVEVAGVSTGLIFGQYSYGAGLGVKLFGTPLIIGINWLMLVYLTSSVTEKYNIHGFPGIISASLMMLVYDLILEQVAPMMDMWHWEDNTVPIQNYAAWFILALGFHSIFKAFNVKARNPLAEVVLISQFCFFLALSLYFNL